MSTGTPATPRRPTSRIVHTWVCRAAAHPYWTVLPFALLLRLGYVSSLGVVRGSDSGLYLRMADRFADGSVEAFGFPLHILYGIALAPAEILPIDVDQWVIALHLGLAAGTVVLLHRTARLFVGPVPALAVAGLAALQPTAIFWFPRILTETLFVFVMVTFVYACARSMLNPRGKGWLVFPLAIAPLLVISRPVGLPIVWVGALGVVWSRVHETSDRERARNVLIAGALLPVVLLGLVFAVGPLREKAFDNASVSVSLWNSTRIWTSDIDHVNRGTTRPAELADLEGDAFHSEIADRSIEFIREHPGDYLSRAGIRFTNFWFPWLTADWSPGHRLYDAALSLLLVGAGLYAIIRPPTGPGRRVVYLLGSVALLQGLIVGVSQIDSEARYRLPAEAPLVALVGVAVARGVGEGGPVKESLDA